MKILIIANSSIGLAKFRRELLEELQKKHDIYIATKCDECVEEIQEKVKKIIEVPMERRGTNLNQEWKIFKKYCELINDIKPDFIIAYTIKPNIYGGLAARLKKIPYAANITGLGTAFQKEGWLKKSIIILYRMALKKAKIVFFENHDNQQIFINYGIVKPENSWVLNGAGVNLQRFSYKDYPPDGKINFLFMGRVMREKGIDELFEAMVHLHKEINTASLTLLGEYEEDYNERVCELSKKGIINYIGWVSDVKPYIEKCMCIVLPSYHEGMSNTLLECAAMGRPIIASNISGCKETFTEGVSGFGVKVKDAQDLYEKMKLFCMLSHEEKRQMGKASRRHVEKAFDKKEIVQTTIERMELE